MGQDQRRRHRPPLHPGRRPRTRYGGRRCPGPQGLGDQTKTITSPPARTVEAPGGAQALRRSELVAVTVTDAAGRSPRHGPGAATHRAGRPDREGRLHTDPRPGQPRTGRQDAALLLTLIADPLAAAEQRNPKDRQRLACSNHSPTPATRRGFHSTLARHATVGTLSGSSSGGRAPVVGSPRMPTPRPVHGRKSAIETARAARPSNGAEPRAPTSPTPPPSLALSPPQSPAAP